MKGVRGWEEGGEGEGLRREGVGGGREMVKEETGRV